MWSTDMGALRADKARAQEELLWDIMVYDVRFSLLFLADFCLGKAPFVVRQVRFIACATAQLPELRIRHWGRIRPRSAEQRSYAAVPKQNRAPIGTFGTYIFVLYNVYHIYVFCIRIYSNSLETSAPLDPWDGDRERERQRGREGGREREKERVAWKKKRGWQFLSTHMDSMKSSEGSQSSRPSSVLALALAPWVLSSSDFEMKGLQAEVAFLLQDPFKARSVRSRPAS